MNLLKEQEIVSQLAAFLASNDLTDNSYSRGLYEAYFALSQNAYQRLEECDRLMQQNMLMEVFNEVNKDPDLQSLQRLKSGQHRQSALF